MSIRAEPAVRLVGVQPRIGSTREDGRLHDAMVMVRGSTDGDRSRRVDDIGVAEVRFERGPRNIGIADHVLRLEEPEMHRLAAGDRQRGAILGATLDHPRRRVASAGMLIPLRQRPGIGPAGEDRDNGDVVRAVDHAPARQHCVVEVRRHDHSPHGRIFPHKSEDPLGQATGGSSVPVASGCDSPEG
ncbi:MAG TPA: hypothetical protein VHS03_16230 [Gaiellaceae bacterium]|nr:hypothetical protein [Gaiellaceae bacterium]